MTTEGKTLAIVGGGAAGLAAAIAAGEKARAIGEALRIVVYESDERVGRSILATGNGRCNFSNAHIDATLYHNASFVADALGALDDAVGPGAVHAFFDSLGLAAREEADGRLFPLANKASVVVDVLRAATTHLGVHEELEAQVASIEPPRAAGKPFTLRMRDGKFERADAIVVACGGRAVEAIEQDVVTCLKTRPVLGPLKVASADVPFARELDNIRVKCTVTLTRRDGQVYTRIMAESGELMFRKYGVSGICVFNLSRFARPGDILRIDFLGVGGGEAAERFLLRRRELLTKRYGDSVSHEVMLRGLLLPRVVDAILKREGIDASLKFRASNAAYLARLLSAWPLEVAGVGDPDISQVRRGGYAVDQFDPATMCAHAMPGFYAVGEALDVDGPCGGYNLHWAWGSGLLAGCAAVDHLTFYS